MECDIDEALLDSQNIFDHMAIGLRLLVAIHVVPPKAPKPCLKSTLHQAQPVRTNQRRQLDESIAIECQSDCVLERGASVALKGRRCECVATSHVIHHLSKGVVNDCASMYWKHAVRYQHQRP